MCLYYNFVNSFGFSNVQVKFLFNPISTGNFFRSGGGFFYRDNDFGSSFFTRLCAQGSRRVEKLP